ncbi:MAG TPA: hypothetical protein VK837_05140 [Longimicrobiales bacterium]|nr:hypothetical protein [Longimicrobiales bacterium]
MSAQRAVEDSLAHADSLRDVAIALQSDSRSFYDAAIAYRDGVRYRARTDATAIGDLILAGRLLNAAGQDQEAKTILEEAAERARSLGHVRRAAEAYVDAAFVAEALGEESESQRLALNAAMLASSPLLDEDARSAILRRVRRTPSTGAAEMRLSRADSLHEEALRAQEEVENWERAGALFMEAGDLRAADDPGAVDVMIVAANLFHAAGLTMRATEALSVAGARAEASGDLVRAARAYLDAAYVAQLEGQDAAARSFVQKAEGLAESPLLSDQARMQILRRITRVSR